jgi:hypothetical protein
MSVHTLRANSKILCKVEHIFAVQKDKMDLSIRTISLDRANVNIRMFKLYFHLNPRFILSS